LERGKGGSWEWDGMERKVSERGRQYGKENDQEIWKEK